MQSQPTLGRVLKVVEFILQAFRCPWIGLICRLGIDKGETNRPLEIDLFIYRPLDIEVTQQGSGGKD